jgi:hypothetical protein
MRKLIMLWLVAESEWPSRPNSEGAATATFMVECYWPELTEDRVRQVLERVARTESGRGSTQPTVRPLESLLVPSDGMVIFLFDGTYDAIQDAAKTAEVPFDRIVTVRRIPIHGSTGLFGP